MAQVAEYEVLHPVRHDGHAYGVGRVLRLTTADGSRLVGLGAVRLRTDSVPVEIANTAESVLDDAAFFEGIAEHKKDALAQFGLTAYGLTLKGTRDEMVAALLNARANAESAPGMPNAPARPVPAQ